MTGSEQWRPGRAAGASGSDDQHADAGAVPVGDGAADACDDANEELPGSGSRTPGAWGYQDGPVPDPLSEQARLTVWVRGRVQGVGFRWWVKSVALELGLNGLAENLTDGRVKVVAEGNRDNCLALLERLEGPATPGYVVQVTHRWDHVRGGLAGFTER